jgi:glycosyltransferase involved in cell wall biosynthesis
MLSEEIHVNVLIIIPAYNEEKSIQRVIASIKSEQPDVDIVVINDGSTDRTSQAAKKTGLVTVIDLPVNVGIGGAMQTGYLYAHRRGYDIAVQIDGDGQHDPAELGKIMLPVMEGDADCCIGSRFLEKTEYRSGFSRRIGIWFFSWMIHWMIGKRFTDPTSGFRAVNKRIIEHYAENYPEDYPEVEAIVMLTRQSFRVKEVSVLMHSRQAGRSSITPFKSMYYMIKVSLAVLITRIRDVSGSR